ncbi:MAG: 4-hydroxy-tetrahydrodipicolinate synthase [Planctomycetota bacterium]
MKRSFEGSYVALPTPFAGGRLDFPAFLRLIEHQIEGGTEGLVIAGTTGESATLTCDERVALIEYGVHVARGRVPVLAGVGTNDTATTCRYATAAQAAGADGLLAVTPYYNRPTPRGLVEHYEALARTTSLPVVLYNVPSRTGVDLRPETVAKIAERCPTVVAIKEASGSLERIAALIEQGAVDVLSGEDSLAADSILRGAKGVIGVVANVAPAMMAALVRACRPGGDRESAPTLVEKLRPLFPALFLETNPAPVKAALEHLGLCRGELRLPLVPVEPETREKIVRALAAAGIGGP